jgi:long-chain acyl-CoA synthetase
MAGHVSVPLYPTLAAGTIRQILEHSESKLLFVGKLDGWEAMKPGVPAGLPCIALPLAPPNDYRSWDAIVAATAPRTDSPVRDGNELSTIMYTSGTTGVPKGVMHSFATFAWAIATGLKRVPLDRSSRILSYLPLAHVAERSIVEHALLATGMHVFFAESLETFTADLQRARRRCSSRCRASGSSSSRRSRRRCRRPSSIGCCASRSSAASSRRRC